jgi:PAS domain S-box-containing protein
VNTLLDFARIEAGRTRGTFEPLDLGTFTADLASTFRSVCERAGLELRVRCDGGGQAAYVDRDMWEKIVLNLLSNAFKFTLEGEIEVTLTRTRDGHELRVRDSGIGIPAESLPHMFERFHRVEGARGRSHEGSGIGLALVQELVRLHGGTIDVASRVGEGTIFTVRIPAGHEHLPGSAIREAALAAPARTSTAFIDEALGWLPGTVVPEPVPDAPSGRKRVLLADDNADLREYARRLLSPHYEVEAVADGAQALAAARARRPDIVVTDVMMPNMDGFALLRELRADRQLRTVPIVMLSARAGEEARLEGLDRGADDYLVKPFGSRELLVRVGAILRAEELRREALRALSESEARFRALAEAAPAFIWFTDARGNVQYVSPQHAEAVGDVAEMADGGWHAFIHPDDLARYAPEFERALRSREPFQSRARIRHRQGHWIWLESHAQPLFDDAGNFLGHVGISVDVSGSVQHEKALEEADRRKDEFLATLSHELRNPLAPLRNALFMLRMGGGNNPSSLVEMMERQVNHLVRLVDDLLEMSRISRGTLELQYGRVDLGTIVRNAVETSQPLVEENGHALSVSLPQETLWLDGDAVRLAQVLSNLLNNAAKYTPARGAIDVNAWREDEQVAVSVQDNGPGIAPELLPRIFDMFTRGQHAGGRGPGGLGIGLALALRIAQMHGGTIEARNRNEGGSEFILRLPMAARGTVGAPAEPSAAAMRLRGLRVLVVDDNRDAGDTLATILEHLGAGVRVARGGEEALRLLAREPADVALLDIGMPGMDGYQLASAIRGRYNSAVVLVALTGWGQDDDRKRARAAGFDHHLVKPVEVAALSQLLASLERAALEDMRAS